VINRRTLPCTFSGVVALVFRLIVTVACSMAPLAAAQPTLPSTSSSGSFSLSATNVIVNQGSSGSSTITVTPVDGHTGTVDLTFDTSNENALQNLCYSFSNTNGNGDGRVTISGPEAVQTTKGMSPATSKGSIAAQKARLGEVAGTTKKEEVIFSPVGLVRFCKLPSCP